MVRREPSRNLFTVPFIVPLVHACAHGHRRLRALQQAGREQPGVVGELEQLLGRCAVLHGRRLGLVLRQDPVVGGKAVICIVLKEG
jgi:hypothetical protein